MKKLFTLMLAVFAMVGMVNAKTFETTLWEGTYTEAIELNSGTVATFKAGNVLRVYVTVPSSGGNFKIMYKGAPDWSETTIPSIDTQWPWVNGGNAYYDLTFTDDDITALSGQNIYIAENGYTITKVVLTGEVPTTAQTELFNGSWTASWDAKTFAAQKDAKIGDVIRVKYTAYKDDTTDWPWVQFNFMDAYGNKLVNDIGESKAKNTECIFDYEIPDLTALEKIQSSGFSIKGDQFILTSVKLLTYADSYDEVSITVGPEGVATYSHGSKNVQISDCAELQAYYASAVDVEKGTVTMTEISCIPASQGVIVKGTPGTYIVKVGGEGWEDLSNKNYLKPSNDGTKVAKSAGGTFRYIFAKEKSGGEETIGFYPLTTADHDLDAHKAYLEISTAKSNTRGIILDFGDGTTAILNVIDDGDARQIGKNDGKYYTLQGTSMQAPTRKGLYILNGKKVLVK